MGERIEIYSSEEAAFLQELKKYLDGSGVVQETTCSHANIFERLIRTIRKGVAQNSFYKRRLDRLIKTNTEKYIKIQYTRQLGLNL